MLRKEARFFLAICRDNKDTFKEYTVYFVNNSELSIRSIHIVSGGYFTDDDDLVQLTTTSKSFENIEANRFVPIEYTDDGAFDFTINYEIMVETETQVFELSFDIRKYLSGLARSSSIPIINKPGRIAYSYIKE